MADKNPLKIGSTGKPQGFETGDTIGTIRGGTGLSTIAANRIPYATALDTIGTSANLTFDGTDLKVGGVDVVVESRTITAGSGLSGGGDLSANRTIDIDITELTEDSSPASGDFILTYDVSASANKKVQVSNLPASVDSTTNWQSYRALRTIENAGGTGAGTAMDTSPFDWSTYKSLRLVARTSAGGSGSSSSSSSDMYALFLGLCGL